MLGESMPNTLHILLRILAGIAGTLLLYVAFFLYEDEEARIQNRLEQIWRRIDALQSSAMSREGAFLQGVTRTTSAILDRLLGHKLLSAQSIAVSMAFSLASFCVWDASVIIELSTRTRAVVMFCALLLAVLASLPAFVAADAPRLRVFRPGLENRSYHFGLMILVVCS